MAVWAADCAPVVLFGANGTTRVTAHAGWRGLAAGIVDVAVDAVESKGTSVAAAVLGPSIHRCCYEFSDDDLERVAVGVGTPVGRVTGATTWGSLALDVPAAVAAGLARRGVTLDVTGACTGCDRRFWSHRRRHERERHALLAWFEDRW
jgi:copper oxidase (laccase) domain-containing protein